MIRYDSEYNQKIARVVSNFNRKVRRLEKEERRLLPAPVSVKDIKEKFSDRRDLNKYLNDLKRFSKKGAEEIVIIKGKEYTKYQIDLFRANLRREREAVRRELVRATSIDHRYPMQHNIYVQNLKNRREKLTQAWQGLLDLEFSNFAIEYVRNAETFDNYLELLFRDAYQVGFDAKKLNYIKNKLLQLSPNEFMKVLADTPEIQFIFDYYHSLTRQAGSTNIGVYNAFNTLYKRIDSIVEQYK